jgi:subtilase family serine protease
MTPIAAAYNSGWAMEIALDVQWVHAIAPLARIVLIESADSMILSLNGGVKLANAMGAGVVSMSFGTGEGTWGTSYDSLFSAAGMSYFAATGDSGAQVIWPAVSANVTAVSGTSLTYSGSGARSETVWAGTGGGLSLYTALPSYQASVTVPGEPTAKTAVKRRGVADVAFNANPYTGQFIAFTAPGAKTPSWYSAGGTSLATPQWAAITAVGNALRAVAGKSAVAAINPLLYTKIAAVSGNYASVFADIRSGADGICATCSAGTGYDLPTGLGTPNVAKLLPYLTAN